MSIQVLQGFYVNVTQKVARPLLPEVAAQIIADLSVWQIHRPGVEVVHMVQPRRLLVGDTDCSPPMNPPARL